MAASQNHTTNLADLIAGHQVGMDLLSYFKEKNLKESLEENKIALGAAFGVVFGIIFGEVIGNVGLGIALGIALGAGLGSTMQKEDSSSGEK